MGVTGSILSLLFGSVIRIIKACQAERRFTSWKGNVVRFHSGGWAFHVRRVRPRPRGRSGRWIWSDVEAQADCVVLGFIHVDRW